MNKECLPAGLKALKEKGNNRFERGKSQVVQKEALTVNFLIEQLFRLKQKRGILLR